jgi:hypothetical protein
MDPVVGRASHDVFPPVGFTQAQNRVYHQIVIRRKAAGKRANPGFPVFGIGRIVLMIRVGKPFGTALEYRPLIQVYLALG